MPKVPNNDLEKYHQIGSSEQEEAERALHQADEDNVEFFLQAEELARNVSAIQMGVKENVAGSLTRGVAAPDALLNAVKAERVQSELYRAVKGNEYYETNGVPDPALRSGIDNKNYLRSENHLYQTDTLFGKIGRKFRKAGAGIASLVGGNNYIERRINERFGANIDVAVRRMFVANRLIPEVEDVHARGLLNDLSAFLGAPTFATSGLALRDYIIAEIVPRLGHENMNTFRIRDLRTENIFLGDSALDDLMLLADINQRESVKGAIEGVSNHERIRRFWDELRQTLPAGLALADTIERRLLENSLWPLEKNPEGKAFLMEIESQYRNLIRAGRAPDFAATEIQNAIENIVANETPEDANNEALNNRINEINTAVTATRDISNRLRGEYTQAQNLIIQITNLGADARSATTHANHAQWINENNAAIASQNDIVLAIRNDENNLMNSGRNLVRILNAAVPGVPTAPLPFVIAGTLSTDIQLRTNIDHTVDFYNRFDTNFANLNVLFDTGIPNNYVDQMRRMHRARISPLEMLQRLLRRNYCVRRNLDPAIYSEEANKISTLSAVMRVKQIESNDKLRNSNRKAAEFLDQGVASRGVDNVKRAIVTGQNLVGLEVMDVQTLSADVVLEQIINSKEEFVPFRGINKYSTPRDLRKILHDSNKPVSLETLERFIQMLEEVISDFKGGDEKMKRYLLPDDWDLENIVLTLQKLKMERWTSEFLDNLRNSGTTNEQAFLSMMSEQRKMEAEVSKKIRAEVKDKNAIWKRFLVKDELKKILDEDTLNATKLLRKKAIEALEKEKGKPNASSDIDLKIKELEAQNQGEQDLFDRVAAAKKHIKDNNLGRKATRQYLTEVGLAGVWDKMSTNFRLQRYWENTKKAAGWMGDKVVAGLKWSREKVVNMSNARKIGSLTAKAATPLTTPLGLVLKASAFPFRLTGRAMLWSVGVPGDLLRMMSDSSMKNYLKEKPLEMRYEIDKLNAKIAKLKSKAAKATYRWDKLDYEKAIAKVELEIEKIAADYLKLKDVATKRKLPITELKKS